MTARRTLDGTRTGQASSGYYSVVAREALPEELDPVALRLGVVSGHHKQVRDVIVGANAAELRRALLELLSGDVDPCLRQTRRSAYGVLASASSAAITRSAVDPLLP